MEILDLMIKYTFIYIVEIGRYVSKKARRYNLMRLSVAPNHSGSSVT